MNGWIGVDLDGTLAHYDGWRGMDHIGAPVAAMLDRVKAWIDSGEDVRIFTARVHRDDGRAERVIRDWCLLHVGVTLPITCVKDLHMVVLWDDRCIQVTPNTGIPVVATEGETGETVAAIGGDIGGKL
jgi:hypothetical protein